MYTRDHKDFVINVPSDPAIFARLEQKLEEYRQRAKKNGLDETNVDEHMGLDADTTCKILVLEKLLVDGTVSSFELSDQVIDDPFFSHYCFDNAFDVINDYAVHAGKHVSGGTGFDLAS